MTECLLSAECLVLNRKIKVEELKKKVILGPKKLIDGGKETIRGYT